MRVATPDEAVCGCEWTKEIIYRSPSEIPVPESLIKRWKRWPLVDDAIIAEYTRVYQRKEWKAYLERLSPSARRALMHYLALKEDAQAISPKEWNDLVHVLDRNLRQKWEAKAREAGEKAWKQSLRLRRYDPNLPLTTLPPQVRLEAQAAYNKAYARALALQLNPLGAYPYYSFYAPRCSCAKDAKCIPRTFNYVYEQLEDWGVDPQPCVIFSPCEGSHYWERRRTVQAQTEICACCTLERESQRPPVFTTHHLECPLCPQHQRAWTWNDAEPENYIETEGFCLNLWPLPPQDPIHLHTLQGRDDGMKRVQNLILVPILGVALALMSADTAPPGGYLLIFQKASPEKKEMVGILETLSRAYLVYGSLEGKWPKTYQALVESEYFPVDPRSLKNPILGRPLKASKNPEKGDLLIREFRWGQKWIPNMEPPTGFIPPLTWENANPLWVPTIWNEIDGPETFAWHNPMKLYAIVLYAPGEKFIFTVEEALSTLSRKDRLMWARCRYLHEILRSYYRATAELPESLAQIRREKIFGLVDVINLYTGKPIAEVFSSNQEGPIPGGMRIRFYDLHIPRYALTGVTLECWNPEGQIVYGRDLWPSAFNKKYPLWSLWNVRGEASEPEQSAILDEWILR